MHVRKYPWDHLLSQSYYFTSIPASVNLIDGQLHPLTADKLSSQGRTPLISYKHKAMAETIVISPHHIFVKCYLYRPLPAVRTSRWHCNTIIPVVIVTWLLVSDFSRNILELQHSNKWYIYSVERNQAFEY